MSMENYRFPFGPPPFSAIDVDHQNQQGESIIEVHGNSSTSSSEPLTRRMAGRFKDCDWTPELFYPLYPGPGKMVEFMEGKSLELKGAYIVPMRKDQPPELILTDFDTLESQTYYDVKEEKYAPMGQQAQLQAYVTTEHVYELQILKNFFAFLIKSKKISCDDLKAMHLPKDGSGNNISPLQKLFDQLPSDTNPEFIVLDNTVNEYKGKIFNIEPGNLRGKLSKTARNLCNLAMVFDMMRREDVYTKFQQTNARIYRYLRDTFEAECGLSLEGGWAPAYTGFMSDYLSAQASSASSVMTSRYAQATDSTNTDAERVALKQLTERYPTASWNFDIATLLALPKAGNGKPTVWTPTATLCSSVPSTTTGQAAASQTTSPRLNGTLMTTTTPRSV